MAYTPKEWKSGEVVTADALSHIEQGIAQSGGGTVEVIKLGSTSIGGSEIGTSVYALQGVVPIENDQTFGEILDGKTIIGTRIELVHRADLTKNLYPFSHEAYFQTDIGTQPYDLIVNQKDTALINEKTVNIDIVAQCTENPNGATVTLYAICI